MRPLLVLALVAAIALPLPAQRPAGRIDGLVTDSVHAAPLTGATVSATRVGVARETTFVATTNARGRFHFDSLAVGRYALRFASPMLDSLQYGGSAPLVDVAAGRTASVQLAVPSGRTFRALACPGVGFPEGTGALLGVVTDAETDKPLVGAEVAVAWSDLAVDPNRGVVADERAARVTVDASGQYRLCGLPTNDQLFLQVRHQGRAGPVLRMRVADDVGVLVRDVSFSTTGAAKVAGGGAAAALPTGTARLHGFVRDAARQPVPGAQLRVLGTAASVRADERGAYALAELPAGTQEIEVRQFGYGVVRGTVELRSAAGTRLDVQLQRVASLAATSVVATPTSPYPEFDRRRKDAIGGHFLDESQIRALNIAATADYVSQLPGFRVLRDRSGDLRIVSTRDPECRPLVLVDDVPIANLRDLPAPSMLGALEAYPSSVGAPATHRSACGTILLWTRR